MRVLDRAEADKLWSRVVTIEDLGDLDRGERARLIVDRVDRLPARNRLFAALSSNIDAVTVDVPLTRATPGVVDALALVRDCATLRIDCA